MNKLTSYIVAALSCAGIFIIYILIAEALDSGGGTFILIITLGAIAATWRWITGLGKKNETINKDSKCHMMSFDNHLQAL